MQLELSVVGPVFFSPDDEETFFSWLRRIEVISQIRGQHRLLHMEFKHTPSAEEVISLLVLFRRWQLDLSALEPFRNEDNGHHILWQRSVAEAVRK
ncbi:hypothetical protein HPT27_04715 [Permianibacter sp. IMCC34836]|uniref:hypothetical protein n=1 Tax=Permianibacter fluminis TaxID=2738515 RepID=UPI0015562322|nr:hypothetical protein [Permianibacter fluminis]NQD36318.1 hypothetical protein [Permianibacter fluminis]